MILKDANDKGAQKEVPLSKVRSNQIGIVISIAIAIVFDLPWVFAVLWLIQVLTLLFGPGANVFVTLLEPLAKSIYGKKNTEAAELVKFNLSIGVTFLTLSMLCLSLQWTLAANIIAGLMGLAALAALLGYCIGCTIYFQYKKYKALRGQTKS
ncbi:DUF4395 family protein [Paenibacillus sp. FSL W7-1287]|uniref:DUF4395 family protein n=1 Tax=Paenibacillus sp. FSL W7-1287 TaxID=2954538 RepID=UPI0030F64BF3